MLFELSDFFADIVHGGPNAAHIRFLRNLRKAERKALSQINKRPELLDVFLLSATQLFKAYLANPFAEDEKTQAKKVTGVLKDFNTAMAKTCSRRDQYRKSVLACNDCINQLADPYDRAMAFAMVALDEYVGCEEYWLLVSGFAQNVRQEPNPYDRLYLCMAAANDARPYGYLDRTATDLFVENLPCVPLNHRMRIVNRAFLLTRSRGDFLARIKDEREKMFVAQENPTRKWRLPNLARRHRNKFDL